MSGFTYPLAFPSVGIKQATPRFNKVVGQNTAPGSLVAQVYEWPGERWEVDLDLPLMNRATAQVWEAWLLSLRGPVGSFLMAVIDAAQPLGAAASNAGTPQVDTDQAALSRVLKIKTGLGDVTGWLKAGDWIQLGSGNATRLHRNLSDASLVMGKATLDIVPPLREAVADNAAIVVSGCKGKYMLSSAMVQSAIDSARRRQPVSITAVEDLRPLS
jgi:hypothetical protein